jgi:hypothetical protein
MVGRIATRAGPFQENLKLLPSRPPFEFDAGLLFSVDTLLLLWVIIHDGHP